MAPIRRIAYLSPVNPAASGISDYSEELLPYLGQYAQITLYIDDDLRPTNPYLAQHLELRPISRLLRDQRRAPYDAVLYHMGNSPVHTRIWGAMQQLPGVLVLHDFVLHHFMLQQAVTMWGSVERYRAEAERRYGAEGARVADLMLHGRFTAAAFDMPFCEDVLARAEGLITHSRYVLDRSLAMRPGLPATHINMGVPLPAPLDRAGARRRRGLSESALLLAAFGHINPYKRLEPVLRALRILRETYDARLLLVGSISPSYDARAVVRRTGLEDAVTITGYVERAAFEDYVAASDICLNLRHPTAGETSASLLRLLGAGRATLVTASGSFTELPPGTAAQVDPDAGEIDLIVAYCRLLADHPALADAIGAAARAYVAREHTLAGAALGYIRFLAHRYGWDEPRPLRPTPLWDPAPRIDAPPGVRIAAPVGRLSPPGAEAPGLIDPARIDALAGVAAALAELGATEDDARLLETTARALRELNG
jgi:glycosyltransferase involved in cell wall biosynthesis